MATSILAGLSLEETQAIVSATLLRMESLIETLNELNARLEFLPAVRGITGDMRVTALTGSTTAVTGSLTTAGTVSTVGNHTAIGGFQAANLVPAEMNNLVTLANINNTVGA